MYRKYLKRLLDILFSLLLISPVLVVIGVCAVLIKLDDGGPVFYCGQRLGKDKKIFKMFKLRSMKLNAPDLRNEDGSTYNSENDPRLTRVGRFLRKTSLDELPQLLNVLKGNMSFIGPRPDLPEHVNYYKGEEIRKLAVLPGITGYNQVYYRNSAGWKQRLKNDIYYVEHMSLRLDIKIFFKTIAGILMQKGIFSDVEAGETDGSAAGGPCGKASTLEGKSFKAFELEWDTDFFGVSSARVVLKNNVHAEEREQLIRFMDNFEFITINNMNNDPFNNAWLGYHTRAFLTDMNIQMIGSVSRTPFYSSFITNVYEAYPGDDRVEKIAGSSFKYSRFFNDPWLAIDKTGKVYTHWIESAFNKPGRFFTIAKLEEEIVGFLLFAVDQVTSLATIELIAVDEAYRCKNIGRCLIGGTDFFLLHKGIGRIKVGTQADNAAAIRFYTSCGFKYEKCNSVYHYWPHK